MTAAPTPPTPLVPHADIRAAYQQALVSRERRAAGGDRPRGYKVGFTNRATWSKLGVDAPMWGTVWDSTLTLLPEAQAAEGTLSITGLAEPRVEPELVVRLAATPPDGATVEQLFECLDWVAPGFELVCARHAGWVFNVPEALAGGGAHAHLLVGTRVPARALAASGREFDQRLSATGLALYRDDDVAERGSGAAVLDGPLSSLQALQSLLADLPGAPQLAAGDVITTGTWTAAWAVQPGQTWRAVFEAPVAPLSVRISG